MPHTRLLPLLVLLGLTACDPDQRDRDGDGVLAATDCDDQDAAVGAEQAWFPDADGDGHHDIETWTMACTAPAGGAAYADDCDDDDPAVNPSMTEICSGVDDDCNGSIDDDDMGLDSSSQLDFHPDQDGDGYGGQGASVRACQAPSGYAEQAGDCDDDDPEINPETAWYADRDRDGWGDEDRMQQQCEQPQGQVRDAGDCDDDDPAIHPDADELCDGIDNDCDALVDDEDPDLVLEDWALDSDADGYGDPTVVVNACAPPSGHVALDRGEDCDDSEPTTHPGAPEICNDGVDNDCDGGPGDCGLPAGFADTDAADLVIEGSDRWSQLGRAVRLLDFDDDGLDDLVVSSWSADGATGSAGESYLFYGPVTGAESYDADLILQGPITRGYSGWTLADAGDTDGDGVTDLLVGSYLNGDGGQAYLVRGDPGRTTGELTLDLADVVFDLDGHGLYAGRGVAGAGDMDGDSLAELMVGAPYDDGGANYSGAVFVFGGAALQGTLTSADAVATWQGDSTYDYLGETMGMAGADLDGDGLSDLMLGVTGANEYMGAVYVAYSDGPLSGGVHSTADADANIVGHEFSARFGDTLAPPADIDGDGYADVTCSAPEADANAGALAVFRGGATRMVGELQASTTAWLWVTGTAPDDRLGYAADVGDINGDGAVELVVGVGGDDGGATDAGSLLVFAGPLAGGVLVPTDASTHIDGRVTEGGLGWSGVAVGDSDGDGFDDLAAGAHAEGDDDGVLYLFLGGSM